MRPFKVRKKPVEVQAIGPITEENRMAVASWCRGVAPSSGEGVLILTKEGTMHASEGDYVIKGVAGEYYLCKPDIFAATYELLGPVIPDEIEEVVKKHAETLRKLAQMGTDNGETL